MSFFAVSGLTAGYGNTPVLDNLSFQLASGTLVGLLGANGSGKTTLLKSICGILPHQGTCLLEGTRLESQKPRELARLCGYIQQRSGVTIDISLLEVVTMGFNPWLPLLEGPSAAMKARAMEMLEKVGLGDRARENYQALSEGQKQLCILARTLVGDGKLLLLDEPESALDFRLRYRMLSLLSVWVREGKRAALAALHDPVLALNCCDGLLLLQGGKIVATLQPGREALSSMEEKLSQIYGPVSLKTFQTRAGTEQIVMLREAAE